MENITYKSHGIDDFCWSLSPRAVLGYKDNTNIDEFYAD